MKVADSDDALDKLVFLLYVFVNALILLVERQEEHPACKN